MHQNNNAAFSSASSSSSSFPIIFLIFFTFLPVLRPHPSELPATMAPFMCHQCSADMCLGSRAQTQLKVWAGTWVCPWEDWLSRTFIGTASNRLWKFLLQLQRDADSERSKVEESGQDV